VEVDFVVYGAGGFWAVEVKNARTVRREDVRSLKALREDYPECEPILAYRGSDRLVVDGVSCLPVQEFLSAIMPGRALGE
jgi:hypothetical protein